MSRFRKLSQTLWHCQYHIVWVPKYRYRVLQGAIGHEVATCIHVFSEQQGSEVVELNVQVDHVHLLVMILPKVSISGFVGTVKGRTAIRVLNKFRKLKEKPYRHQLSGFPPRGRSITRQSRMKESRGGRGEVRTNDGAGL